MRVVSLLPSATELLIEVGGSDLLVGRSHACDLPRDLTHVPMLTRGNLCELDESLLAELAPDVILTQDLGLVDAKTVARVAASLRNPPRIVSLDPKSIFDVFDDLLRVGEAVGRAADAERSMVALRARYWSAIDFVNPFVPGPEVLFLEATDPVCVAGHWTPSLIEAAGARHSLNAAGAPSRRVDIEDILAAAPDRVVICPSGLDLARVREECSALERTRWWPLLPAVMDAKPRSIALIDGKHMFNRPGPRLVDAFEWLVAWINGLDELAPQGFPVEYR